jgi:hypothetical protein
LKAETIQMRMVSFAPLSLKIQWTLILFAGIYPDPLPGGFKGPESCGIVKPANVISTSYGSQEPEMTAAYQIRQCNEYAKLGMMGVTILYSSGDNGVAGFDDFCIDSAGTDLTNLCPGRNAHVLDGSKVKKLPMGHVSTQASLSTVHL